MKAKYNNLKKPIFFKERRKHPRVELVVPISEISCISAVDSFKTKGKSKDISLGGIGMGLKVERKLNVGDIVAFGLELPNKHRIELIEGEVRWVKKRKKDKYYDIGVKFIRIGVIDKAVLRNFIEKKIKYLPSSKI
jgi:c-di-GMP-binding flagellar brake protein YcgR